MLDRPHQGGDIHPCIGNQDVHLQKLWPFWTGTTAAGKPKHSQGEFLCIGQLPYCDGCTVTADHDLIVVEAIQSLELERSLHVRGTVARALKEGGA